MMTQLGMQFGLQILLPGFVLYDLAHRRHSSRREWLVEVGMGLGPAGILVGPTMGRTRLEVARVNGPTAWSLFGDGAWAGERDAWDPDDVRWAVGAGTSILDGLLRLDLSRGLTGDQRRWRLDLYLDAIL